jgi:hypothetical protein
METVSNSKFLTRVAVAMLAFGSLGFECGYYGPVYLLADPGVGPLMGFFTGPIGALVGAGAAAHATIKGFSRSKYVAQLLAAAVAFTGVVLIVVMIQ